MGKGNGSRNGLCGEQGRNNATPEHLKVEKLERLLGKRHAGGSNNNREKKKGGKRDLY